MLHVRVAYSTCLRRIVVKESSSVTKKSHLLSHSRTSSINLNFFSASSQCLAGEKPVILSAVEALKNEAAAEVPTKVDCSAAAELVSNLPDPSFADLGLATTWWPSHLAESLLETLHLSTGLPWWGTIALGTFVLRLVTLPIFISSRKTSVRFTNHLPQVTKLRNIMMEKFGGKDVEAKMKARTRYVDYARTNKVQMWRMILIPAAMPVIFVSCMRALNEMTALPLPSLQATSFLWITSLSAPDPYRLLPFLAGSVVGLNIFVAVKLGATAAVSERIKRNVKYVALVPPIVMPLVFGYWSSSVGLYILANSCITVAITVLLKVKTIETALNMPIPVQSVDGKSGSPVTQMFKDVIKQSKEKTHLKMERKQIQKMLRDEKKARKKELKGSPPRLFMIGSEATLRTDGVPDFKKDWRPPRINIYEQ